MPPRHLRQRLQDMLDAIDRATEYVAGVLFDDYRRDLPLLKAAALRLRDQLPSAED